MNAPMQALAGRLHDLAAEVEAANARPLNCELAGVIRNAVNQHGAAAVITALSAECHRNADECISERLEGAGWYELGEQLAALSVGTNAELDGDPMQRIRPCRHCRAHSEVCTC